MVVTFSQAWCPLGANNVLFVVVAFVYSVSENSANCMLRIVCFAVYMAHFNEKSTKNKQKQSQHLHSRASDQSGYIRSGCTVAHSACQFFVPSRSVVCSQGSPVRMTQPLLICASALAASSALTNTFSFSFSVSLFSLSLLPAPPHIPPALSTLSLSSSHTHLMRQRLSKSTSQHAGGMPLLRATHHYQTYGCAGIFTSCKLDG